MKKVKLPRKRKKLFKKENQPFPHAQYMTNRIINELALENPDDWRKDINHRKFIRKIEKYSNGITKRVISYY